MESRLKWKKGIFKDTFEIYSNGILVGTLKQNNWKQISYGELNGKKVNFKTHGFFKQETHIIDTDTNFNIGKITYNSWMTKATIEYNNKIVNWKYDNAWNTRWSISNSDGVQIRYQGSSSKGTIEDQAGDELLILTGLFVTHYYWQISMVVLIAVFIPIFTTIL